MQPNTGFGHLDSLVDEIQKKQSDHVKLESQLRQQRQRAEAEAAEASRLKSELEAAAAEKLSLQKQIGLLSRKNEDLGGENAKLLEEKCDFQRSMANNEAKLRENESDLRAAQKNFADMLDTANATYSRNRAAMNTLLGRTGPGCAEVLSPDELDGLKAAAATALEASASAQEAQFRVAETEARLHAVVAESKALKGEAAENDIKLQSLRQEVAALKETLQSGGGKSNSSSANGAQMMRTTQQQQMQQQHQRISDLERKVAELSEINSSNLRYMEQMEEYTNGVEAANADLKRQVVDHGFSRDNQHGEGRATADTTQQDNMEDMDESGGGGDQDHDQPNGKESGAGDLMPASAPSHGGKGQE